MDTKRQNFDDTETFNEKQAPPPSHDSSSSTQYRYNHKIIEKQAVKAAANKSKSLTSSPSSPQSPTTLSWLRAVWKDSSMSSLATLLSGEPRDPAGRTRDDDN